MRILWLTSSSVSGVSTSHLFNLYCSWNQSLEKYAFYIVYGAPYLNLIFPSAKSRHKLRVKLLFINVSVLNDLNRHCALPFNRQYLGLWIVDNVDIKGMKCRYVNVSRVSFYFILGGYHTRHIFNTCRRHPETSRIAYDLSYYGCSYISIGRILVYVQKLEPRHRKCGGVCSKYAPNHPDPWLLRLLRHGVYVESLAPKLEHT